MPWLLTSPGHQQPWYWLCKIGRSSSYSRRNFSYLCRIGMEEWHKMQIFVYVASEKFSTQRVNDEFPQPVQVLFIYRLYGLEIHHVFPRNCWSIVRTMDQPEGYWSVGSFVNILRPRQNGSHFLDDIFKRLFLNENCCILMKISLKFVPHCPIKIFQHFFN